MSTGNLLALVLAAVALGLLFALYRVAISRRAAPEIATDVEPWQPQRALRQLTDSLPGLPNLYRRLGFSLKLERESSSLLDQLKAQIQVEIPDYSRFRQMLDGIEAQLASATVDGDTQGPTDPSPPEQSSGGRDPLLSARLERRDDPLLNAVLAVKDDPLEVAHVLNRDPIDEMLPFVEQIPFSRAGRIVWRTPMEISVLRKQPRNPARFAQLLGDLDQLVHDSRIQRPAPDRDAVRNAIDRSKRDLLRDNAYFPTAIQNLESKLADWIMGSRTASAVHRRQQLEKLLTCLAEQHHHRPALADHATNQDAAVQAFTQEVQTLADEYLKTPWMHTPALTAYALNLLLAAELTPFTLRQRRSPSAPGGLMALICAETAAGHYDSLETIRRLHKLEAKGIYVHSLIYSLLRLHLPDDE